MTFTSWVCCILCWEDWKPKSKVCTQWDISPTTQTYYIRRFRLMKKFIEKTKMMRKIKNNGKKSSSTTYYKRTSRWEKKKLCVGTWSWFSSNLSMSFFMSSHLISLLYVISLLERWKKQQEKQKKIIIKTSLKEENEMKIDGFVAKNDLMTKMRWTLTS